MDVYFKGSKKEIAQYIEQRRLQVLIDLEKEQRRFEEEYKSYIESFREYSFENMRDYGHTWGPGIDDVYNEKEIKLPDELKVDERQFEIMEKCKAHYKNEEECTEAIEYMLLACSYEGDDYICFQCETFEEMVEKYEEEKKERSKRKENIEETFCFN